MDGGLSAREHHHLGGALGPHEGIQPRLNLLAAEGEALRMVPDPARKMGHSRLQLDWS